MAVLEAALLRHHEALDNLSVIEDAIPRCQAMLHNHATSGFDKRQTISSLRSQHHSSVTGFDGEHQTMLAHVMATLSAESLAYQPPGDLSAFVQG